MVSRDLRPRAALCTAPAGPPDINWHDLATSQVRSGFSPGVGGAIPRPSVEIKNGGSVVLTLPSVDLRPHHRDVPLDQVVLLAQVPVEREVTATWEATSTGVRGVLRGVVLVPFEGPPWTINDVLSTPEEDA